MQLGKNTQKERVCIDVNTLNRHGVIAGSSGSGKTTTVKTIAQRLNDKDISTLIFDAKGDLKDLLQSNEGALYTFKGEHGKPLSVSVEALGVDLLSNVLELNTTQSGILATAFLIAKDMHYSIITLEDLEALFNYIIDNNEALSVQYGRLSNVSINTIRRKVNTLKLNELEAIFNVDNLDHNDIIDSKEINVIDSVELVKHPKLYASIVVKVLQDFYNNLEESTQKAPKTIIFIDEAHLLFKDTNKHMINDIIQIIKLIRSKGVGVIFISQSIEDINKEILPQLSLKIQHHLNLITTQDYTQARAIARTYTSKKKDINDTINNIKTLQVGQAYVQYIKDNKILNELIQVDYVYKDTITLERLEELTPKPEATQNDLEAPQATKESKRTNIPEEEKGLYIEFLTALAKLITVLVLWKVVFSV